MTSTDTQSPSQIWGAIWLEFAAGRDRDRTNAYLTVLRRLAENGEALVPDLISPKDFTDLIVHLESFVKSDSGAREGSAIEAVQQFLAGDVSLRSSTPKATVQ